METISWLELAWVLPLIPGVIASTMTVRDTLRERDRARERFGKGSGDEFTALVSRNIEIGRLAQQALLLGAGIDAMFQPESPHASPPAILVALLMFVYWLTFNSLYVRYYRRRLPELLRRDRTGGRNG